MNMENVRNMTVTPESGKNVENTKVVDGTAKQSATWNAKNETSQYTTSGGGTKGALGGKGSN